jgi:hypothetical protein
MMSFFHQLAAGLHRLIIRFERIFSQHPDLLLKGRNPQQEIAFQFQRALDLRFTYPEQARLVLLRLLGELADERFDRHWAEQRRGRIYFQLGNLEPDRQKRITHYRQGLENMPDHYRCRELLDQLLQEEAA